MRTQTPDGEFRPTCNEFDDEGETEREVEENYEVNAGREVEDDDD